MSPYQRNPFRHENIYRKVHFVAVICAALLLFDVALPTRSERTVSYSANEFITDSNDRGCYEIKTDAGTFHSRAWEGNQTSYMVHKTFLLRQFWRVDRLEEGEAFDVPLWSIYSFWWVFIIMLIMSGLAIIYRYDLVSQFALMIEAIIMGYAVSMIFIFPLVGQ